MYCFNQPILGFFLLFFKYRYLANDLIFFFLLIKTIFFSIRDLICDPIRDPVREMIRPDPDFVDATAVQRFALHFRHISPNFFKPEGAAYRVPRKKKCEDIYCDF